MSETIGQYEESITDFLARYQEQLKNRGGRPKKKGVVRYPSGKINTKATAVSEKEKRDNMDTVRQARIRQHGIRPKDATSQESGYALGRLFLRGLLHQDKAKAAQMLEAGNRMGLDYDRYYRLTGIPSPNAKAMDMRRVRGIGMDASPADASRAADAMMAVERVLGCVDRDGRPVMTLCKRIILRDESTANWTPYMLDHLRVGLKALVEHYGLNRG